jgi:hypothetical protein
MLPFTSFLLSASLAPFEFARAYCEAFASAAPNVPPKLLSPRLDPSNGTALAPAKVMSSGNRVPSDQLTNSAKTMNTQFYDTQVSTVDYQILFTERDNEAILKSDRTIVTSAMAGSGFASWQISGFVQEELNKRSLPLAANDGIEKPAKWSDAHARELAVDVFPPPPAPVQRVIGLKPENLKYLHIDYQIVSTFDRKPPRDEVGALRDIAAAIKSKS